MIPATGQNFAGKLLQTCANPNVFYVSGVFAGKAGDVRPSLFYRLFAHLCLSLTGVSAVDVCNLPWGEMGVNKKTTKHE